MEGHRTGQDITQTSTNSHTCYILQFHRFIQHYSPTRLFSRKMKVMCWCLQRHEDLGILVRGCSSLASKPLQDSWAGVDPLIGTPHPSEWPSTKHPQQILRNLQLVEG